MNFWIFGHIEEVKKMNVKLGTNWFAGEAVDGESFISLHIYLFFHHILNKGEIPFYWNKMPQYENILILQLNRCDFKSDFLHLHLAKLQSETFSAGCGIPFLRWQKQEMTVVKRS